MARTKASDMRGLSLDELVQKRTALDKNIGELNQKKVTGQLEKPHEFKATRRQIAQIRTIEREKRHADAGNRKK